MNIKLFPYHPYLIAAFQILTVYSINVNEVRLTTLFIVLLLTLFITLIVNGAISLLLNKKHSAIIVSCYVFIFFLYGRVLDFFLQNPILYLPLNRNRYLFSVFVLLLMGITLLIYKSDKCKKNLKSITLYFNQFSLGLLIIAVLTIGINYDWTLLSDTENTDKEIIISGKVASQEIQNERKASKPNVYWLIFDSYANHRVLDQYYDWNDSSFVNSLEFRGFSVDKNARSNYCFTGASIASTLSMRYLHLDDKFTDSYNQDNYIGQFYKNNIVMERFKSEGYDIVTDFSNNKLPQNNFKKSLLLEDFVQLIIHISMLRIFENELITDQLRQNILFMLNSLKQFDKPQKPTFMYLHFSLPHSPFIFRADGSKLKYFESTYAKFEPKVKYIGQVQFAGNQIIEIVDSIRKKDSDAIIIIQADHGYGGKEDMLYLNRNSLAAVSNNREKPPKDYLDQRFGILNAIYSPADFDIPKNTTPVNLFRYIFNEIFDDQYIFLPNKSYFTLIKQPYLFHDVTDDLNKITNSNNE